MMKRIRLVLGVLAMGAWSGCGESGSGIRPAVPGASVATRIAVIPKATTHEFWRSIEAGARKAEEELNAEGIPVEIIWQGPLREDDRDQQVQVVENFTSRGVEGIVLAPLDSRALVRPVETAVEAGIPVVIMDSALQSDRPVSYVATDNSEGGRLAGEHLAGLLGGMGKVILLRYQVGSASTEEREAGFLKALEAFPGIEVISQDQYSGPTRETSYQAAQNLLNRFGDVADGVFCPCEPPTIAMAQALRDIGKAGGAIKMVGFDSGTQSVEDLRKGDVQGLVVQDPLKMGHLAVRTVISHLRGEPVEPVIDTGVRVATPDNMDDPEIEALLHPPLERYLR